MQNIHTWSNKINMPFDACMKVHRS